MRCDITPISAFQSTNLSSKITCFDRLGDRIFRSLGFPMINIELHRDQLYENISIAVEMFTKFAGYTNEFLVFNSNLYKLNYGIKLDDLFSLNSRGILQTQQQQTVTTGGWTPPVYPNLPAVGTNTNPWFGKYILDPTATFIATSAIPGTYFSTVSSISATLSGGSFINEIFPNEVFQAILSAQPSLSAYFIQTQQRQLTQQGSPTTATNNFNTYDYDVMDYRKVISVVDFEEGSSTGINTLFTIEQTLAQQTYFSYAMGNYGFDLVSWYVMKDWLKMREKLLATKPSYDFDDRTQIMRLYPQPGSASGSTSQYFGVIQCYVERPVKDVIKEIWVFQYSLALCKITLGRIREKYQGTQLFGGGTVSSSLLAEGLEEKKELELKLYEGASSGLGDNFPPSFFIG